MNRSPLGYILVVLSTTAISSTALGALSPEDAASLRAALDGKTLAEAALVPPGFTKVAQAKGDLDGDGADDVALIVRRAGKKPRATDMAADDSDDLPQAVLIFSGDNAGRYTLWKLGIRHFMDSSANLMAEGGVGSFEIKKGVLTIESDVSMSMGGWSAGGCTARWRKGPAGFQLIGLTVSDIDRKCACGTTKDTNYLTGLTIYQDDQERATDDPPRRKHKRTRSKPPTILWESFDFDTMCSTGS